jgi:hypothetical protein
MKAWQDPVLDVKSELYRRGVTLAQRFLQANDLPEPDYVNTTILDSTGLYDPHMGPWGRVYVNVRACAKPVMKPHHMCWSWPGYKTDRTPVGVVAHETGHHVEFILGARRKQFKLSWWREILVRAKKERITSYEPNSAEAFAETMRVFILNPRLLEGHAPNRYRFLTETLRLRPSETRSAIMVVGNPYYNAAIKRLIKA